MIANMQAAWKILVTLKVAPIAPSAMLRESVNECNKKSLDEQCLTENSLPERDSQMIDEAVVLE